MDALVLGEHESVGIAGRIVAVDLDQRPGLTFASPTNGVDGPDHSHEEQPAEQLTGGDEGAEAGAAVAGDEEVRTADENHHADQHAEQAAEERIEADAVDEGKGNSVEHQRPRS